LKKYCPDCASKHLIQHGHDELGHVRVYFCDICHDNLKGEAEKLHKLCHEYDNMSDLKIVTEAQKHKDEIWDGIWAITQLFYHEDEYLKLYRKDYGEIRSV